MFYYIARGRDVHAEVHSAPRNSVCCMYVWVAQNGLSVNAHLSVHTSAAAPVRGSTAVLL